MRTRLVFWGKNSLDEKVLIGIKLNEKENSIDIYVFPELETTEDFVTQMHQVWRKGKDLLFPENHHHETRPLNISSSMLPDGYSVDREDILKRAQTEWHFVVLSAKLYHAYQEELDDLKDRIGGLTKFDSGLWEELKGFWSKVQDQVREKNLFHDHATKIKANTNELFARLKKLRRALDQEFQEHSEEYLKKFQERLKAVEDKIQEGLSLQPIFEELKEIQRSFRKTRFTGDHRSQVWKKLDGLFKVVKEKKFGPNAGRSANPLQRVQRRHKGLLEAIQKMERSISRDKKDLNFERKRIEDAEGSLESQIREAKTKMIEERIASKEAKFADMKKTQIELERKMQSLERKEELRKEQERVEKVKEELKAKIAEEIKAAERKRESDETIQKAVQSLTEVKDHAVEVVEDGFEDVIDTIKAVASVIENKVSSLWEASQQEEE